MGAGLLTLANLASLVPDGLPRLSIFDFQPLADILACHCAAAHTPVTGQMEQGGRRFGAGMPKSGVYCARRTRARSGYPCHPNLCCLLRRPRCRHDAGGTNNRSSCIPLPMSEKLPGASSGCW